MGDCDNKAAGSDRNGVSRFAFVARYKLKALLVLGDAIAVMLSYFLTGWRTGYVTRQGTVRLMVVVVFCVVAGLWALRSQGLYLSRVSAVRVVEFTRTARAVALLAVLVLLADRVSHYDWYVRETIIASVVCFVLLCVVRSIYRAWLAGARQQGRYCRRIVIIGTDDEAVRLINLFQTHRDLGLTVVGIVGDKDEAFRRGLGDMWLGEAERPRGSCRHRQPLRCRHVDERDVINPTERLDSRSPPQRTAHSSGDRHFWYCRPPPALSAIGA